MGDYRLPDPFSDTCIAGKFTVTVLPFPGDACTVMLPLKLSMIDLQIASPKPVPLSGSFVVKNGSNISVSSSTGMPLPESRTKTIIQSPAGRVKSLLGLGISVNSRRTPMVIVPPHNILLKVGARK